MHDDYTKVDVVGWGGVHLFQCVSGFVCCLCLLYACMCPLVRSVCVPSAHGVGVSPPGVGVSCYLCVRLAFGAGHGIPCFTVSMIDQNCVLLNWNVRGLNNPARRKVVKDLS